MKLQSLMALGFAVLMFGACKSYEKVPYFQDLQGTSEISLSAMKKEAIRIQSGDKLNIAVSSNDAEMASVFNLPLQATRIGARGGSSSQTSMPFYVDTKGNVDFPIVGKIRVAGMTREEVAETVKKTLLTRGLLKQAVVTVEVLNHYVNVIGEVARPGRVNFEKDEMNILEVISQCGDLTIYGERENVLVLRNEEGVQKTYRVNLTNAQSMYESPAFQLKQDDVIYVTPNLTRQRQSTPWSNSWQNPSIYLSMTSVLVSVAVLVTNIVRK